MSAKILREVLHKLILTAGFTALLLIITGANISPDIAKHRGVQGTLTTKK